MYNKTSDIDETKLAHKTSSKIEIKKLFQKLHRCNKKQVICKKNAYIVTSDIFEIKKKNRVSDKVEIKLL